MDCLLGIDLGSTSLKAVIYDLHGSVLARGSRPTERFHPSAEHPEWTVWQPEQIWGGVCAAVREAVAALGNARRIKGLAVTGMGMDGVPIDRDGRWLYPFISWHDPRTAPQYAWWEEHVGLDRTFAIGGNPVWPINSALRILWMAEHEPAILARTDKWLLIEDFVNFMLCGRRATDCSMASCTMLFDQRALSWSQELLDASGVDRRLLPEVLPSATVLGGVTAAAAEATGLAPGTPVVLGGHDHLCGALPVGAFEPGLVLNVGGTWEMVMTVSRDPVLDPAMRRSGMTVQVHVARASYAIWGGNVAGEMLEWFRSHFGRSFVDQTGADDTADWQPLIEAAASSPPGARRVLFLPHMAGAGCPTVDPQSLGALVGLSNLAAPGDILRAMIEGLSYQVRDMIGSLQSVVECRLERIIAVGGATRNDFWNQNKADVLGRTVEVADVEEATPLGAAILAGIGLGLYRDEHEAHRYVARPARIFEPNPANARFYAERFQIYQELYPALKAIHHRLS